MDGIFLIIAFAFSDKALSDQSSAWPRKKNKTKVTQRKSVSSSRYSSKFVPDTRLSNP